jgi:hypothetical protein
MQGKTVGRGARHEVLEKVAGEGQFLGGAATLTEGAAHERPAPFARGAVDDLGEDRLVGLHQGHDSRQKEVEFLAEDPHDIAGQVLAVVIRPVGDTFPPR